MAMIEFEDGAIQVEVAIVAKGLGIEPSLVQERIRDGTITTLCERGIDDDKGRHRLSFFSEIGASVWSSMKMAMWSKDRRSTSVNRGLPASARRPGT